MAVWITILAVLLVGGVAALFIVLLTGDKGMSVGSYQDQAGRIMEDSQAELDALSWEEFDSSDLDQDSIDSFTLLSKELEAVVPSFEDALEELEGIEPPEEAAELHQDIVKYYEDSIPALKSLEAMSRYVVGIAKASTKLESEMEALSAEISNASSEQQVIGVIDRMIGVIDSFIATMNQLKPPAFMSEFNANLVASMQELKGVFLEMKDAVATGDLAALDAISARADQVDADYQSKLDASLEGMNGFMEELDNLDQELQDLIERLDAL